MWRHFTRHTHARCGEVSYFSTSVIRRNLKLLHMWRKFRFLQICHVERCEIAAHVKKFQNSPHLSCIEIWNFSKWQIFVPQIYLWDRWQILGMLLPCYKACGDQGCGKTGENILCSLRPEKYCSSAFWTISSSQWTIVNYKQLGSVNNCLYQHVWIEWNTLCFASLS